MFEFIKRRQLRSSYDDMEGRNQVFYSRELGIYTEWYLAMRCEEECYRSTRYERPVTLLLIEALSEESKGALNEVGKWAGEWLRPSDLPARLTGGSYAILLVETSREQAVTVAERLQESVPPVRVGMSHCPEDGASFFELTAAARTSMSSHKRVSPSDTLRLR